MAVETASYAKAEAGRGGLAKPRAWRRCALPFSARPPRALNLVMPWQVSWLALPGGRPSRRLLIKHDKPSWQWHEVPTPM